MPDPGDQPGDESRDERGTHPTGWLIIAVLSLIGFVALTLVVKRVAFAFDTPLLTLVHSWDGHPLSGS